LPLLQRLARIEVGAGRARPNRPRLLVLCPTTELVVQVPSPQPQAPSPGLRSLHPAPCNLYSAL